MIKDLQQKKHTCEPVKRGMIYFAFIPNVFTLIENSNGYLKLVLLWRKHS